MIQKKGFMDSYKTKTFRRVFEEFRNTILLKYADGLDKVICSLGSHNDMLAEQINFKELHLVDLEFGECKYKYNKYIHYHETSVEKIFGYEDFKGKFDVVIMKDLVEHLNLFMADFVLSLMHHILAPNGIFILTYPNGRSTNRLLGRELGMLRQPTDLSEADKKVGHKHMYCYYDLKHFDKLIDMKKIQEIGIMFKPLSNSQMDKYFSEKELDTFIQIGYDIGPKACCHIGGVYQNVP